MNPMKKPQMNWLLRSSLVLFTGSFGLAQEKAVPPATIDGVKGVKQEAVQSIKKVEPPTQTPTAAIEGIKGVKQDAVESIKKIEPPSATAAAVSTPQGVNKVDGVNTVNGVKADGRDAVMPIPPPPPVATAQAVNKVDGINTIDGVKAPAPNTVQPIPPPPVGSAVSTIRPVKGVQGINAPKQQNLEKALLIKEGGAGIPTGKGQAAAAALGNGPPGPLGKPQQVGDGRAAFQEFEKQDKPGS